MKYFGNRRPRGFHYTRRFGNEQRDILESLRRGVSLEEIAEQSYREAMEEANSDGSKRNRYGVSRNGGIRGMLLFPGCMLLAVLLLAVLLLFALS